MLIVFLEKALTLIHIETHYREGDDMVVCNEPFSLLNPHHCSTIMSVKKPGAINQTNIRSGIDQDAGNPLESLINNPNGQGALDPGYKDECLDKEMHDDLAHRQDYEPVDSSMAKSKGGIHDGKSQGGGFSRQSTYLQNNGAKIKVLESKSDLTLRMAWSPK